MSRPDAIDVLEEEDQALCELLPALQRSSGEGVPDRWEHGTQCKQLIRRMGVREAAKADIVHAVNGIDDLRMLKTHLEGQVEARRRAMNSLARIGRHVRAIEINRTDDFDGIVRGLRVVLDPEIDWELGQAIPELRQRMPASARAVLHSDHYLRRHAPTKVNPDGFRWYERARVVSWLLTAWDHLEDRPRPIPGRQAD